MKGRLAYLAYLFDEKIEAGPRTIESLRSSRNFFFLLLPSRHIYFVLLLLQKSSSSSQSRDSTFCLEISREKKVPGIWFSHLFFNWSLKHALWNDAAEFHILICSLPIRLKSHLQPTYSPTFFCILIGQIIFQLLYFPFF